MTTAIDPIRFEVLRSGMVQVAEEMAATLRRSAYSTNVKTRQDFSCAFFDRNLRPVALDDLGLIPAMRALARDFHEPDALQVEFDAPLRSPPLSGEAESAVYRAMQEGLSNAVRHGARSRVSVRLTRTDSHAVLTVEDDGPGFPEDAATWLRSRGGLAGIRERVAVLGGELMMGNRNGAGAEMRVELPLQDEAQE